MIVPEFCEHRSYDFPDDFYDVLPQYCPDCEYPMEMTEALTQLHCSNPRCPSKIVQRLCAIANTLGVKGMGEALATKFVKSWGVTNPMMIFTFEPEVDGVLGDGISMDMTEKIVKQFVDRNSFTLAEFVKIANLPFLQMSCFSIFGDFDDLGEAYEKIENGGVEYIREKLGIAKGDDTTEDISIRALKVYDSLMTFKADLFDAVNWVKIIPIHTEGMRVLKAVCSTEVGQGFRTKADFYATCNNLYPDIHIEFGNSVTKDTDYLVWAGAEGQPAMLTNKVKKARAYQDKGCKIEIVSALMFLKILEDMAKKG